jgi:ketosteroid isomerase-like protein
MRIQNALLLAALPIMIAAPGCAPAATPAEPKQMAAPPTAATSAPPTQPPTPTVTPTPDYEAEVRAVTDQFNQAIGNEDAEAYAAFFLPDGLLSWNMEIVDRGRHLRLEAARDQWGKVPHEVEYDWTIDSVEIDGHIAIVRGTYVFAGDNPGKPENNNEEGTYLLIWILTADGTWRLQLQDATHVSVPN